LLSLTHYLYVLSSWSFCVEPPVKHILETYGDRVQYTWRLAYADYDGNGPYKRNELEYYYARLEAISGQRFTLDWWFEGYDATVPDRIAEAARTLGAIGNDVRLALSHAALNDGLQITRPEVALEIAATVADLDPAQLDAEFESDRPMQTLRATKAEWLALGVTQRPTFVLINEIGDKALFSGLWQSQPLIRTVEAMLSDDDAQLSFPPGP
jgi:predicted DsbA family dithiol-disulfide isomerase